MRAYWKHLNEQGFSLADEAYRMFAGEVFHDGELAIKKLDLAAGTLVLELRNVFAVDQLWRSKADDKRRPKLRRNDFRTKVFVKGVDRFTLRTCSDIRRPVYSCSELSRTGETTTLEIEFRDKALPAKGSIKFQFTSVRFEDIRPKVRKYLLSTDWEFAITPIDTNPLEFVDIFRRRK